MKRFLKIFAIVFAALIGVVGIIVGIMYLTGALNKNVVNPESIYFEYSEYNVSYDPSKPIFITVKTDTENVTQTQITLSLSNQTTETNKGVTYITDQVIIVPKYVTLNVPFKVDLCKSMDTEIDATATTQWITGGNSKLFATSESKMANQVFTDINVDVPVFSITLETYQNTTNHNAQTTFSNGDTFYAEASFVPARSQLRYNKVDQFKSVYFESSDSSVKLNTEATSQVDKFNVAIFDVVSLEDVQPTIFAYSFETAEQENAHSNENEAIIMAYLRSSGSVSATAEQEINLTERAVGYFAIDNSSTIKTLDFNKINIVYANYKENNKDNDLSIGINIGEGSSNEIEKTNLQNKIKDVGLQLWVYDNGEARLAQNDECVFVNSERKEIDLTVESDYCREGYVFPYVNSINVDMSYWQVAPKENAPGKQFFFVVKIFPNAIDENDIEQLNPEQTKLSTAKSWESSSIKQTAIEWNVESRSLELTVIDNVDANKIESPGFKLGDLLNITLGSYTTIKYLVYTDTAEDILPTILGSNNIEEKSQEYYSSGWTSGNYYCYELKGDSGIIKPISCGKFNVVAVVLKTDFNGAILTNDSGEYQIYAKTQDNILVTVNKTVRNLSISLEVSNAELLKNYNPEVSNEISTLAFASDVGTDEIFDFVFTVEGTSSSDLENEISLFVDAYNKGQFKITPTNEQKTVFYYDMSNSISSASGTIEGLTWKFHLSVYLQASSTDIDGFQDIDNIMFEYSYQQLANGDAAVDYIKKVDFVGDLAGVVYTSTGAVLVNLYDAKIKSLNFAYENEEGVTLKRTLLVGQGELLQGNVYFASSVQEKFLANGVEVNDILDEYGNFKILAYDKFGNDISKSIILGKDYDIEYQIDNTTQKIVGVKIYAIEFSSTLETATQAVQGGIIEFENDDSGKITQVGANEGSYSSGAWTSWEIYDGFKDVTSSKTDEITIKRKVAKNTKINITGQNGLLSVKYTQNETEEYELCNVLEYSLISNLDSYEQNGVLSYDVENGILTISKALNADEISIRFRVVNHFEDPYIVNLVLQKNINISEISYDTPQGELEPIDNKMFVVYSDNEVHFNLTFRFYVAESNLIINTDGGYFDKQENGTKVTSINIDTIFEDTDAPLEQKIDFYVNFTKDQLNEQTVTIYTGKTANSYEFAYEINFFVYPNAKLSQEIIEKEVVVDSFATVNEILTDAELLRIIASEDDLLVTDINLTFSKDENDKDKVYLSGQDEPLTTNIFELSTGTVKATIRCKDTMYGNYVAYVDVNYGSVKIGTIKVTLSTNIKAKNDGAFVYYNEVLSLALLNGETYDETSLLNLFELKKASGASQISVEITDGNNYVVYNRDSNAYTVNNVTTYVSSLTNKKLVLKIKDVLNTNCVADIDFPIVLLPIEKDYVKYQNSGSIGNDVYKLVTPAQLVENEVWDEYLSGTKSNLYAIEKDYGLSSNVRDLLAAKTTMSCSMYIADENGLYTITSTRYSAEFNVSTGEIIFPSSTKDIFVYIVLFFNNTDQTYPIGLYRIKILKDCSINVYYPYEDSSYSGENELSAEYVYEDSKTPFLTIDLSREHKINMPNAGKNRVMLEYFDSSKQSQYTVRYSLVNADKLQEDYHVTLTEGSIITIFYSGKTYDIVVKCDVYIGENFIGTTNYTIKVNKVNLSSYYLATNNGIDEYTTSSLQFPDDLGSNVYSFANIELWRSASYEIGNDKDKDLLRYYFYIEDLQSDQDKNKFVSLDLTNKTIELTSQAVSDKIVNFVYYTVYGEIHTVKITFKTNYSVELNTEQSVVSYDSTREMLTVPADTEFNLKEIFTIKNDSNIVITDDIDYSYEIYDQDVVVKSGDSEVISFAQIVSTGKTYKVKMKVSFNDFNAELYAENFEYVFDIYVTQTLKKTTTSQKFTAQDVIFDTDYQTTGYSLLNIITTDLAETELSPFYATNNKILKGYTLELKVDQALSAYVSFDQSSSVLVKNDISFDGTETSYSWPIYFISSPSNNYLIEITCKLSKDDFSISVPVKFYLKPDIILNINYPSANTEKQSYEALYLSGNYINNANSSTFATERPSLSLQLNSPTYFESNRFAFEPVIEGDVFDTTRVSFAVESVQFKGNDTKNNDVVVKYDTNLNTNITNAPYNASFYIQWLSTNVIDASYVTYGEIVFVIKIDGVERGKYNIRLCNNITSIFSISAINNLRNYPVNNNITIATNSENNREQYYIENISSSENVFSHNTAIFTFKLDVSKTSLKGKTLIAYIKTSSGSFVSVGKYQVTSLTTIPINWLLNGNEEISKENLYFGIETETTKYALITNNEIKQSVYGSLFAEDASVTNLTYRLSIQYLGVNLSYDKMSNPMFVVDQSARLVDFNYNLCTEPIKAQNSIAVAINSQVIEIGKYYYEMLYDFKIDPDKEFTANNTEAAFEIRAQNCISDINNNGLFANNEIGITNLAGIELSEQYFKNHIDATGTCSLYYDVDILMITNSEFKNSATDDNVRYLQTGYLELMQTYYPQLTKTVAKKYDSVRVTPKNVKINAQNVMYDFDFEVYGAEVNGNYVYLIIKYGANEEYCVNKIVKFKITPITNQYILKSSLNTTNSTNTNTNPLVIDYTSSIETLAENVQKTNYTIESITLGSNGSLIFPSNDYIFIRGAQTDEFASKNLIGDDGYNLTPYGEVFDYIKLTKITTTTTTYVLTQNGDAVAYYGDKTGYIRIADDYGYYEDYYITLRAAAKDSLSLPKDYYVNNIESTKALDNYSFYAGTKMIPISQNNKKDFSSDVGAIIINNFDSLENMAGYSVSYAIDSLGFEQDNRGTDNVSFEIPIISNTATTTLTIIIDVKHKVRIGPGDKTEDFKELTETIKLYATITIVKRFSFSVQDDPGLSVQEGTKFDVSNFMKVVDSANEDVDLGEAIISDKVLTLKVSSVFSGDISIKASPKNTTSGLVSKNITISVGFDCNGQEMSATNGYYYYILSNWSSFGSMNFSDYIFTVSSENKENNVSSYCQLLADKTISLTTTNLSKQGQEDIVVYVHINNGEEAFAVPFTLNYNGVQTKSLQEAIASGEIRASVAYANVDKIDEVALPTYCANNAYSGLNEIEINDLKSIYAFKLSSTPVKPNELQKIKNFEVYDDSIALEIKAGYSNILEFKLVVYSADNAYLGEDSFTVLNNERHIRYVQVSKIIGNQAIMEAPYAYNIKLIYTVGLSEGAGTSGLDQIIKFVDQELISQLTTSSISCTITYSSTFTFNKLTISNENEDPKKDLINVLSASSFDESNLLILDKYYLVKYSNQNTLEKQTIKYKVTPKYHDILYKNSNYIINIYANQYTVSKNADNQTVYTASFATWASLCNLVDLNDTTLASLNNGKDLTFALNTNDSNSSGNAYLDENNNLITLPEYKVGNEYFTIDVKVKVNNNDEELVSLRSIHIKFMHEEVYVANLAKYRVVVSHPGAMQNGVAITEGFDYTFENPVTPYSDLFGSSSNISNKITHSALTGTTIQLGNTDYKLEECNIEVITIIDAIYSVEYVKKANNDNIETEYLQLKFKISENLSSDGQTIALTIQAANKTTSLDVKTIELTISYLESTNEYVAKYKQTINSVKDNDTGVYSLDIPFIDIYPSGIIGEDYIFSAEVANTNGTAGSILYAGRSSDLVLQEDDILLFTLTFSTLSNPSEIHSTILGVRYDINNSDNYGSKNLFAINIENFNSTNLAGVSVLQSTGDTNNPYVSLMNYYELSYLTKYSSLNFNPEDKYFLIDVKSANYKYYSVAEIINYNTSNIYNSFELRVKTDNFYSLFKENSVSQSNFNISAYSQSIFGTYNQLPTEITLQNVNANEIVYYAIYKSNILDSGMTILGLSRSTTGTLKINAQDYVLNTADYITVRLLNYSSLSGTTKTIDVNDSVMLNLSVGDNATIWQTTGTYDFCRVLINRAESDGQIIFTFKDEILKQTTKITYIELENIDATNLFTGFAEENNYDYTMTYLSYANNAVNEKTEFNNISGTEVQSKIKSAFIADGFYKFAITLITEE